MTLPRPTEAEALIEALTGRVGQGVLDDDVGHVVEAQAASEGNRPSEEMKENWQGDLGSLLSLSFPVVRVI
jgi:hypothetical protein